MKWRYELAIKKVFWNIPVTSRLDEKVEKLVEAGHHTTKSELVRFAVTQYIKYLEGEEKKVK